MGIRQRFGWVVAFKEVAGWIVFPGVVLGIAGAMVGIVLALVNAYLDWPWQSQAMIGASMAFLLLLFLRTPLVDDYATRFNVHPPDETPVALLFAIVSGEADHADQLVVDVAAKNEVVGRLGRSRQPSGDLRLGSRPLGFVRA